MSNAVSPSKSLRFSLLSLHIPSSVNRLQIMQALDITLSKGIEACYYAELDHQRSLFYTDFSVLTFVNWSRQGIIKALEKIGIETAEIYIQQSINQDYLIQISDSVGKGFIVSNEVIELPQLSLWPLMIVALVISQSVGLESFENQVNRYFSQGRDMVKQSGRFGWMQREKFADYAEEITLLRHDMVLELRLLDKPNILWDNPQYEDLYNKLAETLELNDRFEVLRYKLDTLKEDIAMMMDLYHHKHSSFLEWIIILLIMVEVVMGFLGIFGIIDH